MICTNGHTPEVMKAFNISTGPDFLCMKCGDVKEHDKMFPNGRTLKECPCDDCAYMDTTEREDTKYRLIPGRCLYKGYRITADEGPCEGFIKLHSEKHLTMDKKMDVHKISKELLVAKELSIASEKRRIEALHKSTLDYWMETEVSE